MSPTRWKQVATPVLNQFISDNSSFLGAVDAGSRTGVVKSESKLKKLFAVMVELPNPRGLSSKPWQQLTSELAAVYVTGQALLSARGNAAIKTALRKIANAEIFTASAVKQVKSELAHA